MDKPKDAIERMKAWLESQKFYELCQNYRHASHIKPHREGADTAAGAFERIKREIAGYLPDGAVCVEWPAELTKRRLLDVSHALKADGHVHYAQIVDALAAIAPHTKRKCELWIHERGQKEWLYSDDKWTAHRANMPGWRCVARNVELED